MKWRVGRLVLKGKLILKFCGGVLYSSIDGCTPNMVVVGNNS